MAEIPTSIVIRRTSGEADINVSTPLQEFREDGPVVDYDWGLFGQAARLDLVFYSFEAATFWFELMAERMRELEDRVRNG